MPTGLRLWPGRGSSPGATSPVRRGGPYIPGVEGDILGQLKPEPGWVCFAEKSWVCTGFVLV